ncbi:MAG: patatin-like phospholipase family protein [Pseudomonadota bacterium]
MPSALNHPSAPDGTRVDQFKPNGVGLSCSGGGYKSGAYQVGAFIRLNEVGMLPKIDRISSVSGGSISAAYLALNWDKLIWQDDVATNFDEIITAPLTAFFTSKSIDVVNIMAGLSVPFRTGASGLQNAYKKYLFGDATLQDFPDPEPGKTPRFVILATDFELNTLWRFAKPYAANYRVGEILTPTLELSAIVTASSAFPPFFCPFDISLKGVEVRPFSNSDRHEKPYIDRMRLADAGIYDNLGAEPVWKTYGIVLVSNAGDPFGEVTHSKLWWNVLRRSMSMMHRQAENNRMRWLHDLRKRGERHLADWHLRENVGRFSDTEPLRLKGSDLDRVQEYPVRLQKIPHDDFGLLLRHGYSMCNAALHETGLVLNGSQAKWPQV